MTVIPREQYRGFVIEAHVHEIRNDFGWNSGVHLVPNPGTGMDVKTWHLPATYKTLDEAIQAAISHGRKKVDDFRHESELKEQQRGG